MTFINGLKNLKFDIPINVNIKKMGHNVIEPNWSPCSWVVIKGKRVKNLLTNIWTTWLHLIIMVLANFPNLALLHNFHALIFFFFLSFSFFVCLYFFILFSHIILYTLYIEVKAHVTYTCFLIFENNSWIFVNINDVW